MSAAKDGPEVMDIADSDEGDNPEENDNPPAADEEEVGEEEDGEDPEEYVVAAIRARRKNPRTGTHEYLVKWEGYPESDNTWEPADNLKCPELVQKFLEEDANKRKRKKVDRNQSTESAKKSQSPTKRSSQRETKNKLYYEDENSDEDEYPSNGIPSTERQKQKQTTAVVARDPTPEPVQGFARELRLEKIVDVIVGHNDELYSFVKWNGLEELELIEAEELEKNAPYELCRWYRERFFCQVKHDDDIPKALPKA